MGREHNETPEQLAIEEAARAKIADKWSVEILKLQPHVYGVDWAFMKRDALHSWGEYKRRHNDRGTYQTLDISLGKWLRLKFNAMWTLVPFAIYVEWDDGLYYNSWPHMTGMGYNMGVLRREDRGQPGDVEPSIKIPITEFKRIDL